MRNNRTSFYSELTPLARAIQSKCAIHKDPPLSLNEGADTDIRNMAAAAEKRAAKLARRAARAGHKGETK